MRSFASRHQRTRPYTPRHNGKVERYQQILANELLYAHPWLSEAHRRDAIATWSLHYNDHRPHSAAGDKPPASRLPGRRHQRHEQLQSAGVIIPPDHETGACSGRSSTADLAPPHLQLER